CSSWSATPSGLVRPSSTPFGTLPGFINACSRRALSGFPGGLLALRFFCQRQEGGNRYARRSVLLRIDTQPADTFALSLAEPVGSVSRSCLKDRPRLRQLAFATVRFGPPPPRKQQHGGFAVLGARLQAGVPVASLVADQVQCLGFLGLLNHRLSSFTGRSLRPPAPGLLRPRRGLGRGRGEGSLPVWL